jgi:hypothetical protein
MEVQSLVVIEALASGTPVVGLSNETIDELVSDDVGAWLPKDATPENFARAIEQICRLSPEAYMEMCQSAQKRVAHLDWPNIVSSTAKSYQEILKHKPSMSDDESDMLTSLVSFLVIGDGRDYLLDVIADARKLPRTQQRPVRRLKVPSSMRSWIRVPSSTWFISGLTIIVSVIGYLFMKGRGKRK